MQSRTDELNLQEAIKARRAIALAALTQEDEEIIYGIRTAVSDRPVSPMRMIRAERREVDYACLGTIARNAFGGSIAELVVLTTAAQEFAECAP